MTRKRRLNIASNSNNTHQAKSPKSKKKRTTLMKRRYSKHRGGLNTLDIFANITHKMYMEDGWMSFAIK